MSYVMEFITSKGHIPKSNYTHLSPGNENFWALTKGTVYIFSAGEDFLF